MAAIILFFSAGCAGIRRKGGRIRMKKPLIILTGPTAVGKTELSIALAQMVKGAVVSADSMQV